MYECQSRAVSVPTTQDFRCFPLCYLEMYLHGNSLTRCLHQHINLDHLIVLVLLEMSLPQKQQTKKHENNS